MLKGIQIFGILIGLFLLFNVILKYKDGKYSLKRTVFIGSLWVIVTILFYEPSIVSIVLPILSTKNAMESVLTISILVIFILYSQLYNEVNRLNSNMTKLVQELSINAYLDKDKNED